jgi:hypothetical protein
MEPKSDQEKCQLEVFVDGSGHVQKFEEVCWSCGEINDHLDPLTLEYEEPGRCIVCGHLLRARLVRVNEISPSSEGEFNDFFGG